MMKLDLLSANLAGASKGRIKVNRFMKTIPADKHIRGFTLVELIVVMAIFVIVIGITGNAFNLIMKQSILQSRTAESNIEGVIGLEIMRRDLVSAGFGLPWSCPFTAVGDVYQEAAASETIAANYNDTAAAPMSPRAVCGGNDLSSGTPSQLLNGTDYLVVRATSIGTSQAAQRWSYMNYTGMAKPTPVPVKSWSSENLESDDRVVVVSMNLSGEFAKDLVLNGTSFSTTYNALANSNFEPQASRVTHYIYGVTNNDPNIVSLRMPFNRADYYVRRPAVSESLKIPNRCAPNTGILFKAIVNQKTGTFADTAGTARGNELPLLDCVADMQVVYSLQSASTGVVTDTNALIDSTTAQPLTAAQIRTELKAIQVYILTHEGGKDQGYTYPNQFIAVGPSADGINTGSGRKYDLKNTIITDWQQYRWKVYRMLVNPLNMNISTQ
jgi:prepilin-type N-terminal cleavage/methylation domain-containing protein